MTLHGGPITIDDFEREGRREQLRLKRLKRELKMKIICIKFPAGEDIICKVVRKMIGDQQGFTDDFEEPFLPAGIYEVEDVLALAPQQLAANKMGIALIPWMLGNFEGKVFFDLSKAVCVYKPLKDVETSFLSQTSGLVVSSVAAGGDQKVLR